MLNILVKCFTGVINGKPHRVTVFNLSLLMSMSALSFQAQSSCHPDLRKGTSSILASLDGKGDLCELSQRYLAASERLRAAGVDPLRISNIRAPRFIRVVDWENHKQQNQSFDPRQVYDRPGQAPGSVWLGWDRAAQYVDQSAHQVFEQRKSQASYIPLGINSTWILRVQNLALVHAEQSISGRFRQTPSLGLQVRRDQAPTVQEIETALQNSTYNSSTSFFGIHEKVKILNWTSTLCYEEMTPEQQAIFPKAREKELDYRKIPRGGRPFRDERGQVRQCGFFMYAEASQLADQIKSLEKDVNTRLQSLHQGSQMTLENDPLFVAARAQRWLVSLHPFTGGNGRTSRLMMDFILQSYGLPTPILRSHDIDLVTADTPWAQEVAQGLLTTLRLLEECAAKPRAPFCVTHPGSL